MRIKQFVKIFFVAIFIIVLGYYSMSLFSTYKKIIGVKNEKATISNEKDGGKVLAAEEGETPVQTNFFSSQNFHSPQISFGGEAITFPEGQQSQAPQIVDMRSELLLTKADQQVRFLLSWKTNKPCLSSITYKKESQSEGKTIEEDGYGFIHSVEISPLNFSTSYSYTVSAKDKWGNETISDKLAFYTGAPNVSIFDLLGGAFKDMFGWATK